jgi:hypothetical protein
MRRLFGKRDPDPPDPPEPGPCPTARASGTLPADGAATAGGVALPSGRRVRATLDEPDGPEVLWCTDEAPLDPLGLWSDLARDDEVGGILDPFGHTFPGLGHGVRAAGKGGAVRLAQRSIGAVGALALIPVTRPADAPAAIGWTGACNYIDDVGLVSCVLRSWEGRYDAILLGLGQETLVLAVRRPPSTSAAPARGRSGGTRRLVPRPAPPSAPVSRRRIAMDRRSPCRWARSRRARRGCGRASAAGGCRSGGR